MAGLKSALRATSEGVLTLAQLFLEDSFPAPNSPLPVADHFRTASLVIPSANTTKRVSKFLQELRHIETQGRLPKEELVPPSEPSLTSLMRSLSPCDMLSFVTVNTVDRSHLLSLIIQLLSTPWQCPTSSVRHTDFVFSSFTVTAVPSVECSGSVEV